VTQYRLLFENVFLPIGAVGERPSDVGDMTIIRSAGGVLLRKIQMDLIDLFDCG